MAYGEKKLEGGHASAHPVAGSIPIHVAPSTSGKEINRLREELISTACWKLDDCRFAFDSSFVLPTSKPEFAELAVLRTVFPGSPLSLFGHADPVGDDTYNKALSGRRVRAIYAILIRDVAMWEHNFTSSDGTNDLWGLAQSQTMLRALGFDPGNEAGSATAQSTQAVKDFQTKNGLTPDGDPGKNTRAALIPQYFAFLSSLVLTKDDFLARGADPGGKGDYQGCSEFNPLMMFSAAENAQLSQDANKEERNRQNSVNRRVLALLFRPGTVVPPEKWPCPRSNEGPGACLKRFWSDAAARRSFQGNRREFVATKDTFACRFYQRIAETSPCEGVPLPRLKADPLIFVSSIPIAPVPVSVPAVGAQAAPAADTTPDPVLGPGKLTVVVKREGLVYKKAALKLTTDIPFDGTGLFTRSDKNIDFFRKGSATALKFDGKDNSFTGPELAPPGGVELEAVAVTASGSVDEITLTLALSGGTVAAGPNSTTKATAVEIKLDICEPRIDAATAPVILPTLPPNAAAPAAGAAKDKFFLGRPLPLQTDPKIDERAMLIVQPVKPAGFAGKLILKTEDDKLALFSDEEFKAGEAAQVLPLEIDIGGIPADGQKFFVEGRKAAAAARDSSVILGLKDVTDIADQVKVTVCHTEVCSDKKPADLKLSAQVPEKPARVTKSTFVPAPLIMGKDFDVQMRPFIEIAKPSAFEWKTASDKIKLKDAAKEVLQCHGEKLSAAQDDVLLELFLTTDIGKLKKRHKLTVVTVTMNPVSTGSNLKHSDDINVIVNPAGCVILTGGDEADAKQVPKFEIAKIVPDLAWTDDDDRIAWWIVGGEAAGAEKFSGKADFRNTESSKRGLKIQVFGTNQGDVLIQPYSGGFGYGMVRTHVIPLFKMKYRVNRIFTTVQAAAPKVLAFAGAPEQLPQDPFPGNGAIPPQPAVPALPKVEPRPEIPAKLKRDAHAPTSSHEDAKKHIAVANIYLRQAGLMMIPDNSAEVARPARAARAELPFVAKQLKVDPQVATPQVGAVAPQAEVKARAEIPEMQLEPEVKVSVVNDKVGVSTLDDKIIEIKQHSPGHFDVEVDDQDLVFNATDPNSESAIRINCRNEVVSLAYIESGPAGTLANALLCPMNHAPHPRADPPTNGVAASSTFSDKGTPSSSLKPKTGIPPDVPVDQVDMTVLGVLGVVWEGGSPAVRDTNLLWGAVVPNVNIDTSPSTPPPIDADRIILAYGNTLAHELCHVWGLGHRGPATASVPDGLAVPPDENLMHGNNPPPVAENLDIIQVKALRFSEVMFRTP